jgi:serine/threonine protein kinase
MTISATEVWQRMVAAGVISLDQCNSLQSRLATTVTSEDLSDCLRLAKILIHQGVINAYQAKILLGQSKAPLRLGSWLILGPVSAAAWRDWVVVRRPSAGTSQESREETKSGGQLYWARPLNADLVKRLGGAKSIIDRGRSLKRIQSPWLHLPEEPVIEDNRLWLRVPPLEDVPLMHWMSQNQLDAQQTVQIANQLVSAVAGFHQNRLVHGRVLPDRVFWNPQVGVRLACEPILAVDSEASSPNPAAFFGLREDLGELPTVAFLAPEWLAGKSEASTSTDLYSLGATGAWLMTGKNPADWLDTKRSATKHKPSQNQIGSIDGVAEHYLSCFQRCMLPDPQSRFTDAVELLQAMNATRTTPPRPTGRRRRGVPWWLPVATGGLLFSLALMGLYWSGAIHGPNITDSKVEGDAGGTANSDPQAVQSGQAVTSDPLNDYFQLTDHPDVPWAPPAPPNPLDLSLLPPGAHGVIAVRPTGLLHQPNMETVHGLIMQSLSRMPWLKSLWQAAGLSSDFSGPDHNSPEVSGLEKIRLGEIQQMTLAIYSPLPPELPESEATPAEEPIAMARMPEAAVRIQLANPIRLSRLMEHWAVSPQSVVDEFGVLKIDETFAVYLPKKRSLNNSVVEGSSDGARDEDLTVSMFTIARSQLIQEVVDLDGEAGPLPSPMKKLLEQSNRNYDFSLLMAPRYLHTEGRVLLGTLPAYGNSWLDTAISPNGRALLAQSHLEDRWYWELQMMGSTDSEATAMVESWRQSASQASTLVETWLNEDRPQAYWRKLAIRLPGMLRFWRQHARFAVEDGVAVANGYLPPEASSNLLAAAWICLQENAFQPSANALSNGSELPGNNPPLDIEAYLNRSIRLSLEQEPIERVLAMIAEEANENLPASSPTVRFELDGAAFQQAGITRNQQIRQLRSEGATVRQMLTELARRGNPTTNVTDLRDSQQQLIWVIRQESPSTSQLVVWLTTRSRALESGWALPTEFTAAADQ